MRNNRPPGARPDRRTSNLKWRIPCDRPACQPRGVGVVGQCSVELQAGADLELGEDLAQVVLDGARADEQPGADLRVRRPSRASRAIWASCAVSSSFMATAVRLRAVSPVARSSRWARSANASMPIAANMS